MKFQTARGVLSAGITVILFLSLLFAPAPAQAGTITVEVNQADPDFPQTISFQIQAKADVKIEQVTLIYGVSAESCLNSQARHEMAFDPAESVDLSWDWDLFRSGDLPPGVEIWWQWQIRAADGAELVTDVSRLTVEDPGFSWKSLTSGQISLYWAEGSNAFGQNLLDIAVASLNRLAKTSNLVPTGNIRLTIYPTVDDLKNAMNHTTDWMGGVAFSEYRIVLIAISPENDLSWPREVIPHELAHLVFGQRIFNCLGTGAPSWFNEGFAMYAEGPVTDTERDAVLAELKKDTLQPLTSIANGFPADSRRANLAYLQSKLLVDYLIESYGKEQLEALLDLFQEGRGAEGAFRSVYGLDTEGLDLTWRASLGYGTAPEPDFSTPTPAPKATAIPTLALVSPLQQQPTSTQAALVETAAPTTPVDMVPTSTPAEPAATNPAAPNATPAAAVPARSGLTALLIGGGICAGLALLAAAVAAVIFLSKKSS